MWAVQTVTSAPPASWVMSGSCWVEEPFCSTTVSPVWPPVSAAPAMSTAAPWSSKRRALMPVALSSYQMTAKPPSSSAVIFR